MIIWKSDYFVGSDSSPIFMNSIRGVAASVFGHESWSLVNLKITHKFPHKLAPGSTKLNSSFFSNILLPLDKGHFSPRDAGKKGWLRFFPGILGWRMKKKTV